MGVAMEEDEGVSICGTGELPAKKPCSTSASVETSSDPPHGHDLNFPIPGGKGLPCLVKVCLFRWLCMC